MRPCITNDVDDLRSCTVRGCHVAHCADGSCTGCFPRQAERGFLCHDHVLKVENLLEDVVELVGHLWSIQSNGIADTNERVAGGFGPQWPLADSRIRAEQIVAALLAAGGSSGATVSSTSPLREVVSRTRAIAAYLESDLDEFAGHPESAADLVRLVDLVQATLRKFPLRESTHRIPGVRCPNCSRASLLWTPPIMQRDEVRITCQKCGHAERQEWLESFVAMLQTDPRKASA